MDKKWLLIGTGVLIFIALLAWLFMASTKPVPQVGTKLDDLGRNHVTDISNVSYNSNPPTSGSHFPVWAKRGVYDRVLSDGYLIHSLEHGYIVISYNCNQGTEEATSSATIATDSASIKPLTQMKAGVSGEMSAFTPENPPEKEVELPESYQSEQCKNLVNQLSTLLQSYQRIIVVPRLNLDSKIALTAWTRLEKLDSFDEDRIKTFIEAYHNKGPERTIE